LRVGAMAGCCFDEVGLPDLVRLLLRWLRPF
jgi:hypothetical protein